MKANCRSHEPDDARELLLDGGPGMTRRRFLGGLATAASTLALARFEGLFSPTVSRQEGRHRVVSFHLDQPYLDWSGTAVPYYPPPGARSAEVAAHLTEEMLRRICINL